MDKLRFKLKQKIESKKLERVPKKVRDEEIKKLSETLEKDEENGFKMPKRERKMMNDRLEILFSLEEKDEDNAFSSKFNSDSVDYSDKG